MAYRLLMPKRRGVFHSAHVWVEADHLLHIDNSRFNETYQRFRFDEILAITFTQRESYVGVAAILLAVTVLLAGVSMWSAGAGARVFLGIMFGGVIGALVAEIARGPRCHCDLHTAVGRRRLSAVDRMSRARLLLERLQPLILAAQGDDQGQPIERPEPEAPTPAPTPELPSKHRYPIVDVLFHATLLVQGLLIVLFLSSRKTLLTALLPSMVAGGSLVCGVVGLYLGIRHGARLAHLLMVGGLGLTVWDWARAIRTSFYTSSEQGVLAVMFHRAAMVLPNRKATGIEPGFEAYSAAILWAFVAVGVVGLLEAVLRLVFARRERL